MKVEKITVNKTSDQPDGIGIQIIQPQSDIQERVLSFLLASAVREAKREGRITYDIPDQITIDHKGQGTFVISAMSPDGGYYQPPQPVAIVGIRVAGNAFDLVHAEVQPLSSEPASPPPPTNATTRGAPTDSS